MKKAEELAAATAGRVERVLDDHEQLMKFADALGKPLTSLQNLVTRGAASSVSSKRLLKRAARRDPAIGTVEDIRLSDLSVPDHLLSRHTLAYGVGLGLEGAATSLLVTGFVVASSVSGGTTLSAAAAALSADVSANLAASSRLVAKVAMSYGYDAQLPEEQIYALGVLNYGSTVTAGGKAASLGQLSRLVQAMMRNPSHAQLDKYALIQATKAFLKLLGFRATHQRLAQLVPFAGIVINAGTNVMSITTLSERAQDAYRLRFLTEKYNLDAAEWLSKVEVPQADDEDDSIDLEQLIDEAKDDPEDSETATDA